ncbi:hypothetical protein ABZ345_43150 [Lentzea sp. NPDC005914]|uniref:hypothetical protein n=1 Tax=Lentzea sp. NPDC005914 TaxID=3154572 RepID=UPI0033CA76D8
MTEEQPSQEWGAPQPAARPAWTAKKTVAAVAIAVGIAAAGGVAIYAASGTNQQTGAMGGPGGMGGPPDGANGNGMRGPGLGLGSGSATHGEFQTGEVTSISDTSLEVKSTDGYTKTYVIDADTVKEGVENGDTVTVIATTEDGKTVASSVVEPGQRGQQGRQAPPTR